METLNDHHLETPVAAPPGDAVENRAGKRHSLVLLAGRVAANGTDTACLVHNISRYGLMARFTTPLAVGDRLSVEVRGLPPIDGWVRWTREGKAGVQFDQPQDIDSVFQRTLNDGTTPRSPRFPSLATARAQFGAAAFDTNVLDISLGGAKLSSKTPMRRGQAGQIQFSDAGVTVFGTVCWVRGDQFGLRFAYPMPIATLAKALSG